MSKVVFEEIEVAETLCNLTLKLSIRRIDKYDGEAHKFQLPELSPNDNEIATIRAKFNDLQQFPDYKFSGVVSAIIQQTSVEPLNISHNTIRTAVGDKGATLKELQHIVFDEGDARITDTIYMGKNRFFVLSTSRSTIMPGDILEPISVPLNIGEKELFKITRDGKEFQPKEFEGYTTPFRTHPLKNMIEKSSPDIYDIIDNDERFGGGKLSKPKTKDAGTRLLLLIDEIKKHLKSNKKEIPAEKDIQFPSYESLLTHAKSLGIGSYLLNLLIETFDRATVAEYTFIEDDWEIPAELIEDREKKRKAELQRRYNKIKKEFEDELKQVKTRRVGIFFKAAGKIGNIGHIKEIEKELEKLADEGFGTHKWAEARRNNAIAQSKPGRWENLITAAKLVATLGVAVVVAIVWLQSKQGVEMFNLKVAQADAKVAVKEYQEAREIYDKAYEEYSPRITMLLVSGTYKDRIEAMQKAIEQEVSQGIEDLNTLLSADGGRFTTYTQELLSRLLQLDPENQELLTLKDICVNQ